jgi:hypothetical protein
MPTINEHAVDRTHTIVRKGAGDGHPFPGLPIVDLLQR